MKFCWCTINVKNMDESVKFYGEFAQIEVKRRFTVESGLEIAFLGDGETQIELLCDGKTDVKIGEDISIGFVVKSVDEMIDFVKQKGVKIVSGPTQPNPYIKYFFIHDPNGLKVQFVENTQP